MKLTIGNEQFQVTDDLAKIIRALVLERLRQDEKFGLQLRSLDRWICIETEELGETAHAADEWDKAREWREKHESPEEIEESEQRMERWLHEFEVEMAQVLAVAAVALESVAIQRRVGIL